jgi:transcriptional regulator with XRE-family HTH domain
MANLRRIRQEQGLSYAELSRRLTATGHPISDTGLLKTERGDRRVDVDDLAALAAALDVSPARLLLPGLDIADPEPAALTSGVSADPAALWAWSAGETPLGAAPVTADSPREDRSAEIRFSRANRPHHWHAAPPPALPVTDGPARMLAITALTAAVIEAFRAGASTADIRDAAEGALAAALVSADPQHAGVRITVGEDGIRILAGPETGGSPREAQA